MNVMDIPIDTCQPIKLQALQEKRAVAAGLLRHIFGPPLYMRSIAAFFVTAAIGRVFCGIL